MSHTEHLDLVSGLKLPSVSQIPGIFAQDMSGFEDWICKGLHSKEDRCCTQAKRQFYQESADLGNDIHSLMDAFLRGESFVDGVPEYQANVFAPVAQFFKESGYVPLRIGNSNGSNTECIELKMTGKEFGGTLDTAGTFAQPFWDKQRKTFYANRKDDDLTPTIKDIWVVDLKIKSKLDPLHPLQLYGYSLLLKECYGIESKWGLIVRREKRLDKTPEIQLKGYFLPAYKEIWDHAFACWKFLNQ
jgi:hypothetical protein